MSNELKREMSDFMRVRVSCDQEGPTMECECRLRVLEHDRADSFPLPQ